MQSSHGLSTRFRRRPEGWVILATGALVAVLAALIGLSVQRPLWYDETMAMVNYPLANPSALIAPLPYYSQAAPALFNLICTGLIAVPTAIARTVLFLLIAGGLCVATFATYRRWWVIPLVAAFALASPFLVTYATTFKYYGLEVLGAAVILAWFVTRTGRDRFRPADLAILALGMVCGISTIVLAALALLLQALARLGAGIAPRRSEWALALTFVLCALLYYASIRVGTAIQIANFPDIYGHRGLARSVKYVGSVRRLITDTAIPLVAIATLIATMDRSERNARLAVLAAAALLAFGLLSVAGFYPATTDRHVAWASAFVLFLLGNAVHVLIVPPRGLSAPRRRVLTAALALCAMLAAAPNLQRLVRADTGALEDNDRLVAWMAEQPAGPIALWIGAQPMVQFYRGRMPALDKHHYIGWRDPRSEIVPRRFLTPAFLSQPRASIGQTVEARRQDPGSYNTSDIVYRSLNDYAAPADTLIAEARRYGTFSIVASHLDYDATFHESLVRRDGLLAALRKSGCRSSPVLKVKGGFVLQAHC